MRLQDITTIVPALLASVWLHVRSGGDSRIAIHVMTAAAVPGAAPDAVTHERDDAAWWERVAAMVVIADDRGFRVARWCAACLHWAPQFSCAGRTERGCDAMYCSLECQRAHWARHKATCGRQS